MRSAMCAIGRYETTFQPITSVWPMHSSRISAVYTTLNWLIITPLGGPVVPEV